MDLVLEGLMSYIVWCPIVHAHTYFIVYGRPASYSWRESKWQEYFWRQFIIVLQSYTYIKWPNNFTPRYGLKRNELILHIKRLTPECLWVLFITVINCNIMKEIHNQTLVCSCNEVFNIIVFLIWYPNPLFFVTLIETGVVIFLLF